MALTRANAEFITVSRLGPLLTAAGMAVTVIGSNADLNDPIGHAVRDLGHATASVVLITDADVAQVTTGDTNVFLYLAELHALEAIAGNLDDVTIRVGPLSEHLSDLVKQVERKIERLIKTLHALYGYGEKQVQVGYIRREIAEHG